MTFQKGGNAVDAACAMLAATTTMCDTLVLGRRDPGADLQPADREGRSPSTRSASRRPGRRRSSSAAGAWPIRPSTARSRRSRPGTPGGLMLMLAEYGKLSLADVLAPGDRDGRRLPDRGRARRRDRAREGADREVALLEEALPDRIPARRARLRGGRDLPPAGPRRDAAKLVEAESGRARRPARAAGRDPRGLRPLLPGRHRRGVRARRAGAGRPHHARGPRAMEGRGSRSRSGRPTRASTSTSSTSGRRDRRCSRR